MEAGNDDLGVSDTGSACVCACASGNASIISSILSNRSRDASATVRGDGMWHAGDAGGVQARNDVFSASDTGSALQCICVSGNALIAVNVCSGGGRDVFTAVGSKILSCGDQLSGTHCWSVGTCTVMTGAGRTDEWCSGVVRNVGAACSSI